MKTELKEVIHLYLGCEMTDGRILHSVDIDGEWMLLAPNGGGCTNFCHKWDESVKPILHRLEDMTEMHENEVCNIIGIMGIDAYKHAFIKEGTYMIKLKDSVELYTFLLKNGYDIFGLIDSGQAVDYKTLK